MEVLPNWGQLVATTLGVLCSALGTILWFLFTSVKKEAQEAKAEAIAAKGALANYKLYAAEHFVTQTDLTKAIDDLKRSLERLIESVDRNSREAQHRFDQLQDRIDKKADK